MGQSDREDGDAQEAAEAVPQGFGVQLTAVVGRHLLPRLDAAIGRLQALRARMAPAQGEEGSMPEAAPEDGRPPRAMLRLLLEVVLLIVGIYLGALFSYELFARKLESQGELIASQAADVSDRERHARRTERDLERSDARLKDATLELEQVGEELRQVRMRLAEIEGHALIHGARDQPPARPVAAGGDQPPRARGKPVRNPEGSCDLNSSSAGSDLSRCLGGLRQG